MKKLLASLVLLILAGSLAAAGEAMAAVDPIDDVSLDARVEVAGHFAGSAALVKSGYLLTAAHVVGDAKWVGVKLGSGEKYSARVVKADACKDLALLKINATTGAYTLGDETAYGFYSHGNNTRQSFLVREGYVVAYGEKITIRDFDGNPVSTRVRNVFDIAIDPGFSGGALLDDDGELEGINLGSDQDGLMYAATLSDIRAFLQEALQK